MMMAFSWPGQFGDGNIVADFESYFVMDDQYNAEFQYYPDPSDSTKRGIGVEVSVRGYQYAASVAEDIIFFQYEVKNASKKTLNKVVIGIDWCTRILEVPVISVMILQHLSIMTVSMAIRMNNLTYQEWFIAGTNRGLEMITIYPGMS